MCGGFTESKPADAKVNGLIKQHEAQILALAAGKKWDGDCTTECKDAKDKKACIEDCKKTKECAPECKDDKGVCKPDCTTATKECLPECKDEKGKCIPDCGKDGKKKIQDVKTACITECKDAKDKKTCIEECKKTKECAPECKDDKGVCKPGCTTATKECLPECKDEKGKCIPDCKSSKIKVLSYSTQVVAGCNYKIKCDISGRNYEVVIYEKLPCYGGETEVTSVSEL